MIAACLQKHCRRLDGSATSHFLTKSKFSILNSRLLLRNNDFNLQQADKMLQRQVLTLRKLLLLIVVVNSILQQPLSPTMDIPLKVTLTRKGEVECIRRVTLYNPSLEVVYERVKEWSRGSFELGYKDDEGDIISMDAEVEWEECVRLWKEIVSKSDNKYTPLRLEAKKKTKPHREHREKKREAAKASSPLEQTEELVEEILTFIMGIETKEALASGMVLPADFNLDSWLKVTPSVDGQLHLDADLKKLNSFLSKRGLEALDISEFSSAVTWFEFATRLSPMAVSYYNLACSHSNNSSPDQALVAFEKSLELGYRSFNHIMVDTDLNPLRELQQFSTIMLSYFGRAYEKEKAKLQKKFEIERLAEEKSLLEMERQEMELQELEVIRFEKLRAEEEAKIRAEEEARKVEEEARQIAIEALRRAEEEARKAEEEEEEARLRAEEEAKKVEEEARQIAIEALRRAEEEARLREEARIEEERRVEEEKKKIQEAEESERLAAEEKSAADRAVEVARLAFEEMRLREDEAKAKRETELRMRLQEQSARTKYASQIERLSAMGFTVDSNVLDILRRHEGSTENVLNELLSS